MAKIAVTWAEGADTSIALPAYETDQAAGADIRANLPDGPVVLVSGMRALIPTGLRFEIPPGFEVQVRPRSGLALKHGVTLVNAPGTIDSDYRGAVGVIVMNTGKDDFAIAHGMRIAQIVVAPVIQAEFSLTSQINQTSRGARGFGSTGSA
ncbi:MAG: dUTP diphosphatase [Roseobacter sp.]